MSSAVWEELVATALLGTERRPPARPSPADGALGEALDALAWEDPEGALLGAAGLLAGYRAAGWQPAVTEEEPAPAPDDARPVCSPGAAALLSRLLDSGPGSLLPEWLALARAAGVRPPPEMLPDLLDAGTSGSLRAAILAAGGPRLRWLAGLDERWSWAASEVAADAGVDERWRTGIRDERALLLRAVRTEDPARGRDLLASTWSADGAADRAALLGELAAGLQPADEPFLESALDDRSKVVRRQAADLLARLGGSALAERMAQRLRPLVGVGGRLRRKLDVQLPPKPDEDTQRDGVDDAHRPQHSGIGERAWHLTQIVGAAPLAIWQDATGADPAAIVAMARGTDHERALQLGWTVATRRQRDPRWAAVLARETADTDLLDVLAPEDAGDLALALLDKAAGPVTQLELLERIPGPWSPAFSRAALARLGRSLSAPPDLAYIRFDHLALRLDLQARDAAAAALGPLLERDLQPGVRARIADVLSILDLRHAMTRELTQR